MKKHISLFAFSAIAFSALLSTTHVMAKTFTGVIKGAECHLYGKLCSEKPNDVKPELERDFVLVSNNSYYLLRDLPYAEKLKLNDKTVKVTGDLDNQRIKVSNVVAKSSDGTYQEAWDWDKISFELYEDF